MRMPHFTVTNYDGRTVAYDELWQRKNVALIVLDDSAEAPGYASALRSRLNELTTHETACVITRDVVEGFTPPAAAIADRWGEIHKLFTARTAAELPTPDELIGWLRYVQMQCPECQGEAR